MKLLNLSSLTVLLLCVQAVFAQSNTLFNPDYSGDGFIGVDDILMSLSFFGNPWDGPVDLSIAGCTNLEACNYLSTATTDDGSCDYSCFGCVSPSMDDYTYDVVQIGDQCWFRENLRTTTYATGEAIPTVTGNSAWEGLNTGATCVYENNEIVAAASSNGRLYNWYAVNNPQGLCPSGWHVPSNQEWTELWNNVGAASTGVSTVLKSTSGWDDYETGFGPCPVLESGNGSNLFDFSALPSGYRYGYFGGNFDDQGEGAYWWTATGGGSPPSWYIRSNPQYGPNTTYDKRFGLSVRCVMDAE